MRRKSHRPYWIVRPWCPLALLLVGCSSGKFNAVRPATEATLTYPLEAKVTTLDPGKVQDVDMTDVLSNVFEGLVAYDERNGIVGRLATRWDVKDNGRTYVFHLRNAEFHDGTPLKASDFKRTWERNLSKALASPVAADYLGDIVGAKAVVGGEASTVTGVKAVDDRTLSVTLDQPRPYFLGNLTYPCAFVVGARTGAEEMRVAGEAIGTGPFRLDKVAEDTQVDLAAFARYWGGRPRLDRIVRPVASDAATRLGEFKSGAYDLVGLPRGDVESVSVDPKLKSELSFEPRPAVFYFLMNQRGYAPFKDARVRRAFAMALDRDGLVARLLLGETPAHGLVAPGVPGYQAGYKGLPYDLAQAKALLAQAGYPGGRGLPKIDLAYRAGRPDARLACEAAATAWRKDLGAPVSPRALEWGTLLQMRNHDRLQMGLMSWYADYLDPQNFLSLLMTSSSKLNHDGYSNAEFDRLCAAADVDGDATRRKARYARAERIAVEDAARIPLYFERQPLLVSSRVKGLRKNLFGLMPHTTVSVGD